MSLFVNVVSDGRLLALSRDRDRVGGYLTSGIDWQAIASINEAETRFGVN